MEDDFLDSFILIIEEANLVSLFVGLVLGFLVAPVNKETVVVVIAILAKSDSFNTFYGFFATAMANYISYFLFFLVGQFSYIMQKTFTKKSLIFNQKRIGKGYDFIEKYGSWSILIGYFIPGVRQALPFILGVGFIDFKKFMLIALFGSILWTGVYFLLGFYLGDLWFSIF